ncbi:hypothetical protein PsorP6_007295 [Peronosclerospora sorghi]|uniref:Uncharacterized protein n=1 Tax=Peronosclerospora sorghi TaxID=230839 RepID=A0ACC0W8I5_9STRA|nr:hypothetical protein PsorP6_007295 [Peronosclerospora sorghi]
MATSDSRRSRIGSDDETGFGWQLFHDRHRNLIYYLHSYTGEVRWPRPETVGFVMHGLKPLPAHASIDAKFDTTFVNPDIWSPYYPHVVMLPSGLVRVHPRPGSENQSAAEIWCGYNRFPLTRVSPTGTRPPHYWTNELNEEPAIMMSRPRVLPPTWEESPSGSPFLPPYPVTILQRDDTERNALAAPRLSVPNDRVDQRFHKPESDVLRSYSHPQTVELGRVQSTRNWPMTDRNTIPNASASKQSAAPKGSSVPTTEKKEHNRKGYLLRQARKMMRESGVHSAPSSRSSSMLQRPKHPESVPPPKTRLERPSSLNTNEDTDDDSTLKSYDTL